MDWKNLIPWDWFKHEDSAKAENTTIPVRKTDDSGNSALASPMNQLHQDINRIFDEAFNHFGLSPLHSRFQGLEGLKNSDFFKPNIDVSSNDNDYLVSVEAPGLEEKDLSVELRDDVLTIKGNKQEEKEEKDGHFYRSERRYGSFQRVLSLPKDAKADEIKADMKNGVLSIRIPKDKSVEGDVKKIAIGH